MVLGCPYCGRPVDPGDINVAADLAKCAACGSTFAASEQLGEQSSESSTASPVAESNEPPRPERAPSYTRVRLYDDGQGVTIQLPPQGFHIAMLFIGAFAVAWWSFLFFFLSTLFGISCFIGDGHHMHGDGPPLFMGCFMTPFFVAGIAMIGAVVWPIFGVTRIRLSHYEASCKRSLFGIGTTKRGQLDETSVQWSDKGFLDIRKLKRRMPSGNPSDLLSPSHIQLTIGAYEISVGQHLSLKEQEWLYHEIIDVLSRS